MADSKISALPTSSTPLTGAEVLPVVQSGTTKQVNVTNLTEGRTVSMLSANISTGAAFSNTRLSVGNNTGAPTGWGIVSVENCGGIAPPSNVGLSVGWNYSNGGGENNLVYGTSAGGDPRLRISSWNGSALTDTLDLMANSNVRVSTQNLVFGTAAKGVNFTANTPAAGMTSQLLNWYEEGTWTPGQGGGLTVVGTFGSSGKYTRIGRMVVAKGVLTATTSLAWASGAAEVTNNLPFTTEAEYPASAFNGAYNATAALLASNTQIYSVEAMAATTRVTFCVTYFV